MNAKRIAGLVILIIGIIVIIYAVHCMNRIANAKGNVNTMTAPMSGNSVGNAVGGMMKGEVSQYDMPVMWLLIGGIVLGVIGAGMSIFCCKRNR